MWVFYVIMFIAIMYRKVVFENYKGVGPITSKSLTRDILAESNAKDKCLLIMKDLLLLFSALNNISVQINIKETSKKRYIDSIDEDSIDCFDEDIEINSNNDGVDSIGDKIHNKETSKTPTVARRKKHEYKLPIQTNKKTFKKRTYDSLDEDDEVSTNNDVIDSNGDDSVVKNVDKDDSNAKHTLNLQKCITKRVEKKGWREPKSQKCEVEGSCIRYESKEEIFRTNRIDQIKFLENNIRGGHIRLTKSSSNSEENEIVHILSTIQKFKISPKEDLGITDLFQCLVEREGPNGKPTDLSESKLKELINMYMSRSDNATIQAEVGIRRSAHKTGSESHTVPDCDVKRKSPRKKNKGTQHADYQY